MNLIVKTKSILQKILGFDNYLFFISVLKYGSLEFSKKQEGIFKFIKLIPENTHVLDIGANIGVVTATIAKNAKVFVHSFEPIPANAKNVKRLTSFLGVKNTSLYQTALGRNQGEVEMLTPRQNNVLYEGYSHIINGETQQNDGLRFKVKIDRLDDLFHTKDIAVSAIKIDVENHELEVLQGGVELIKRNRPIIYCELWNNHIRFEVISFLNLLGYRCYVDNGRELKETDGSNGLDLDFFFLHEN